MGRDGLTAADFAGTFMSLCFQIKHFGGNGQRASQPFAHRGKVWSQARAFRHNDCVNMDDGEIPRGNLGANLPQENKTGNTLPLRIGIGEVRTCLLYTSRCV